MVALRSRMRPLQQQKDSAVQQSPSQECSNAASARAGLTAGQTRPFERLGDNTQGLLELHARAAAKVDLVASNLRLVQRDVQQRPLPSTALQAFDDSCKNS